MNSHNSSPLLFILLSLVVWMGCDAKEGITASQQGTLLLAEKQWQSQEVTHYAFDYQKICFCFSTEKVTIVVNNNVVISATPENGVTQYSQLSAYPTIPQIFDQLKTILNEQPNSFVARYAPQTGIPEYISVDESSYVADDEFTLVISNFRRLR